jgi:hypothetical protein
MMFKKINAHLIISQCNLISKLILLFYIIFI